MRIAGRAAIGGGVFSPAVRLRGSMRQAVWAALGAALAVCLLAMSARAQGGLTSGPTPKPPPATPEEVRADRLAARLRDYLYATYDLRALAEAGAGSSEAAARASLAPARAQLERARGALIAALEGAGLGPIAGAAAPSAGARAGAGDSAGAGRGLAQAIGGLRTYFEVASPWLRFLPRSVTGGEVVVVRIARRREVPARDLAGRTAAYRVVLWDEVVIRSSARYRGRGTPGPLSSLRGQTIYLDRGAARRAAAERVGARRPLARALERRIARGEALTAAEVKSLLRARSLGPVFESGGVEPCAAAICREEETRLAALMASAGPNGLSAQRSPEALRALGREATLRAIAAGDPRYQAASALASSLVAPGSPVADGARGALASLAGGADLTPLLRTGPARLRAAARRLLPASGG